MTAERAKWWTYLAFISLSLLTVFLGTPGSTLSAIALGALGSFAVVLATELALRLQYAKLLLLSWFHRTDLIRLSIAYLVRIRLDDEYLLIWSERFRQFQPVGGVYKRLSGVVPIFDQLGVLDDDKLPINEETRGDLRVLVRGQKVPAFLKWFETQNHREVGPWREFYHELIETGLLPRDQFPFVMFRWVRRHDTGFKFSEHFQCHEIKVADIFQAELTPEQEQAIRKAASENPSRIRLANADTILRHGVTREAPQRSISESAEWLLA